MITFHCTKWKTTNIKMPEQMERKIASCLGKFLYYDGINMNTPYICLEVSRNLIKYARVAAENFYQKNSLTHMIPTCTYVCRVRQYIGSEILLNILYIKPCSVYKTIEKDMVLNLNLYKHSENVRIVPDTSPTRSCSFEDI